MKILKRFFSIFKYREKKTTHPISEKEMKKEAKVFASRYGELIEKLSHE